MNCDAILELVSTGRSPEGQAVEAHLAVCAECRARVPAARALGTRLRDPLMWEDPPPHLVEEVVRAVAGEAVVHRRRPRWWIIGAAAVVGAAVALALLADRSDWTQELVPRPVVPEATATVAGWNLDHGTRMVLDVAGLEPAEPGTYYELWLTAPDGRHVSAGTFRDSGRIEVTAGVRRSEFPHLWVTHEPADDGSRFGETVLDTPE
jgi:anti-sigma factor RsiW